MRTNAEELRERIREQQLVTAYQRRFFPDVALEEVITKQVVVDVISFTAIAIHQQEELVEFVLDRAKKIFCILVCLREVRYIDGFSRCDGVDLGLPFMVENLKEIGLSDTTAEEFDLMQWEYLAPVFGKKDRQLRPQHILPFKSDDSLTHAVGGYGAVRRVELYSVHQDLVSGSSANAGTVSLSFSEQPQWVPVLMVCIHP